jgi:hypothetical protein
MVMQLHCLINAIALSALGIQSTGHPRTGGSAYGRAVTAFPAVSEETTNRLPLPGYRPPARSMNGSDKGVGDVFLPFSQASSPWKNVTAPFSSGYRPPARSMKLPVA